jgi:hypothetical protein
MRESEPQKRNYLSRSHHKKSDSTFSKQEMTGILEKISEVNHNLMNITPFHETGMPVKQGSPKDSQAANLRGRSQN